MSQGGYGPLWSPLSSATAKYLDATVGQTCQFSNDAINWLDGSNAGKPKARSISNVSGAFHKDSIMRKFSYTILNLENYRENLLAFGPYLKDALKWSSCKSLTKLT